MASQPNPSAIWPDSAARVSSSAAAAAYAARGSLAAAAARLFSAPTGPPFVMNAWEPHVIRLHAADVNVRTHKLDILQLQGALAFCC